MAPQFSGLDSFFHRDDPVLCQSIGFPIPSTMTVHPTRSGKNEGTWGRWEKIFSRPSDRR